MPVRCQFAVHAIDIKIGHAHRERKGAAPRPRFLERTRDQPGLRLVKTPRSSVSAVAADAGRPLLGTFCVFPVPTVSELAARLGYRAERLACGLRLTKRQVTEGNNADQTLVTVQD